MIAFARNCIKIISPISDVFYNMILLNSALSYLDHVTLHYFKDNSANSLVIKRVTVALAAEQFFFVRNNFISFSFSSKQTFSFLFSSHTIAIIYS